MLTRIATGIVLIAVALAAVWFGGSAFTALAAAATLLMFAEWAVMFRLPRGIRVAGLVVLAMVIFAMRFVAVTEAVALLAAGAGLLGLFAGRMQKGVIEPFGTVGPVTPKPRSRTGFWVASGILYCGLPGIALIWLRGTLNGLDLTIWLLAVVWATDIAAYFTGRAIGGPKLAPRISPNKTWAGAIGGVVAAALVGAGFIVQRQGGFSGWVLMFALLSAVLAVTAVLGDLFESHLKRRAGVKDSGTLLPGHGGVLDRLDGLVPVAILGSCAVAVLGMAS